MQLVLSSSSPARKMLLQRFAVPFEIFSPDIDESLLANESVKDAVERLAISKAKTASSTFPEALIIGSDQLIILNNTIMGKPHTHDKAVEQLTLSSNNTIHSYTGLCLYNSRTKRTQSCVMEYQVKFQPLSERTIEEYLQKEQPYHCAGSIKAECLGPTLFEWMRGDDPSALTGLPLIKLNLMLRNESYNVLEY